MNKKPKRHKRNNSNQLRLHLFSFNTITFLRNVKFNYKHYLINYVCSETLTTRRMIPWTRCTSPPTEESNNYWYAIIFVLNIRYIISDYRYSVSIRLSWWWPCNVWRADFNSTIRYIILGGKQWPSN